MGYPSHGDAHLYTAYAYYVIGLILVGTSLWVWWTHPVNRVFLFGPYLTERGIRVVLMSWPLVALFGAFIFSCALDHHIDWYYVHGNPHLRDWLVFFSAIEAVISNLTAAILVFLVGRGVYRRFRK